MQWYDTIEKNKENRVKIYALSASWTGSCQLDEKRKLAVYILHPAETHVDIKLL